jgi:hypothetical protein
MCKKVDCEKCGKPTWKGCGQPIEQALKEVPVDERSNVQRFTSIQRKLFMQKMNQRIIKFYLYCCNHCLSILY